ncbi:TetR/AcrR family transcriptional regulator [Bradyrhizobium centrosematis]|uniref:TetR/AcrR family transcriptional regulator n=1 Tax=Bradyrhizobium centrosematis TaxID=1300039 RepID=UPI00388E65B4
MSRSLSGDPPHRRRGAVLEDALLQAAWAELEEHGYAGFTMEGVAQRAGTSRPVLSRRWVGRAELAVAAIGRHFASNPINVPDLGSVREELALLLRKWSERATPAPIRFMLDLRNDLAPATHDLSGVRHNLAKQIGETDMLEEVLRRGVARGEVDTEKLSPRVKAVPIDLARNELFVKPTRLSDQVIYEIIDLVFLPLVRKN